MPTFALNGKYLVYIAAYKKHIGLYPAPTGVEEFQEAVSQYGAGKGTLKFPLDQASPTCASASSNNRRASSEAQCSLRVIPLVLKGGVWIIPSSRTCR